MTATAALASEPDPMPFPGLVSSTWTQVDTHTPHPRKLCWAL